MNKQTLDDWSPEDPSHQDCKDELGFEDESEHIDLEEKSEDKKE